MSVDIRQFHQVYFEECFEGLEIMESGLLDLSIGAPDAESINTIFRAAHSIKGGGGTFGFRAITDFTHVMETLLDEMRAGTRQITRQAVEILLESVDRLRGLVVATRDDTSVQQADIDDTLACLQDLLQDNFFDASPRTSTPALNAPAATGWRVHFAPHPQLFMTGNDPARLLRELFALGPCTVVCDATRLPARAAFDPEICYLAWDIDLHAPISEAAVREVFEWVDDDADIVITPLGLLPASAETAPFLAPTPAVDDPRNSDRRQLDRRLGERKERAAGGGSSIRVDIEKVDALINMIGQLVITQSMLSELSVDFSPHKLKDLHDGLVLLERNTRDLQEGIMNIRMMAISFSFNRFPRLVRDLSTKLGKEVQLKLLGETTELDKTVLEKLGDPLTHLVRNALDHGLETPAERVASGKPACGTLTLNAFHEGGTIVVEISDDGTGLNRDLILAKARERGLLDAHGHPTEAQIYQCIFAPGFSTAAIVTEVSGRGVGMDVVRRNINELGGSVDVESVAGRGALFRIRLPLTLAILDGQLVRVGHHVYIISLVTIIESLQIRADCLTSVAGQTDIYRLRTEYLPIVRLHSLFAVDPDSDDILKGLLVVVEADGRKIALLVDELLGQQQVVVKSLQTNFRQVEGISGATILGNGTVAMILDMNGLVRLCREDSDHNPLVHATPKVA